MKKEIDRDSKPYIIAEAGTNHNGVPETAMELVRQAQRAGADSVKFQIINPEGLYVPLLFEEGKAVPNPVIEARRKFMLHDAVYGGIARLAEQVGVDYGASVFDQSGLDLLTQSNPAYVKIASCDLNNLSFLRKVVERIQAHPIRLIIATGMSTLKEIEVSLSELTKRGFSNITLLHCVSVYPAEPSQMNLRFIETLSNEFGMPVGLSDHTEGNVCAVAALSLGAVCFEKHITLDRSQPGFDHAYAMEPAMFGRYVSDIRDAWTALQQPPEKIGEAESLVKKRARRSIYAARSMGKGEVISDEDMLIVRPEAFVRADEIDLVRGRRTKWNIERYEPFRFDLLE
jgi:N,N'-diacetyllegionaminate synthase